MKTHDLCGNAFPEPKDVKLYEVDDVMYSLWLSFNFYLGLPCEGNSEPTQGYRFEADQVLRDHYLGQAIRMRNKYAALRMRLGKGQDVLMEMTDMLSQIDSNLLEKS